jgi:hypothetical protein
LKKVRITKKVADEASGRIEQKKVDKEIHVRPGWKDGTKITFERAGDELPGIQPADIIFVIRTRPHEYFERDGDDLIYNVSLLLNFLHCFHFYLYSLCCVLCYRSVRSPYNKRFVDFPPQ